MTAIAGFWAFDRSVEAGERCRRSLAAQTEFGPHDTAVAEDGPVALGRNLYRLLPEDAYDRQPERSADGNLMLVADIRLDNRPELVAGLGLGEAEVGAMSDAAILLRSLSAWGEGALDRLVGAFAFAAWDARAGRLLLARDPVGQRPLYVHRGQHGFAFATMPRGLLTLPDVCGEPDEEQAARFLALMPESGTQTFYKSIQRVVPGECLVVTS